MYTVSILYQIISKIQWHSLLQFALWDSNDSGARGAQFIIQSTVKVFGLNRCGAWVISTVYVTEKISKYHAHVQSVFLEFSFFNFDFVSTKFTWPYTAWSESRSVSQNFWE